MKSVFILLITLVTPVLTHAQIDFRRGFIVNTTGDTVSGFIDYRSSKAVSGSCYFKKTQQGETQKYTPGEIKGYGFVDDKHYETKALNVQGADSVQVFAEVLIKGKLNLYSYNRIFYLETNEMIILPPKVNKTVETATGKSNKIVYPYVGVLNSMLADCGMNANGVRYEEREIVNLIRRYNVCKGGEVVVHKQKKKWTTTDLQLFAGEDISTLKIDGVDSKRIGKSYSPLVGVGVDFSAPRINEKIFLSVEAIYIDKLYQWQEDFVENASLTIRRDNVIKVTHIKVPIGFRYNFLKETRTPYVKLGFVQYFSLKARYTVLSESQFNNVVTAYYQRLFGQVRPQTGFWLSVGYSHSLIKQHKAFIEFRYEVTNGFVGSTVKSNYDVGSSVTNINVLVGLQF